MEQIACCRLYTPSFLFKCISFGQRWLYSCWLHVSFAELSIYLLWNSTNSYLRSHGCSFTHSWSFFSIVWVSVYCCWACLLPSSNTAQCRSGKVDAPLCCKSPVVTKRMPFKSSTFLFNFHWNFLLYVIQFSYNIVIIYYRYLIRSSLTDII